MQKIHIVCCLINDKYVVLNEYMFAQNEFARLLVGAQQCQGIAERK